MKGLNSQHKTPTKPGQTRPLPKLKLKHKEILKPHFEKNDAENKEAEKKQRWIDQWPYLRAVIEITILFHQILTGSSDSST